MIERGDQYKETLIV